MEEVSELSDKWNRLKELLRLDPEFQTRNPEAYELLFEQEASMGVNLPSFGIRVPDNWHSSMVVFPRERRGVEGVFSDAFCFQHSGVFGHTDSDPRWPHTLIVPAPPNREEQEIAVTGRFPPIYGKAWYSPLDATDLQGILLAILSGDDMLRCGLETGPLTARSMSNAPPVRMTDLRLAGDLFEATDKDTNKRRVFRPFVDTLPDRLTQENTIQWKYETLRALKRGSNERRTDPDGNRIRAVVFMAAAICLFLDLGGPSLAREEPLALTNTLVSLADEIRKVMTKLARSAEVLAKVVADRPEGKQKRGEFECLFALSCYRMGYDLRLLAERNGIRPFNAREGKGTKNWRRRVMNLVTRGVDIEWEQFRQATDIFDNRILAKRQIEENSDSL